MQDYKLPTDINYQKKLYTDLGIGNDASLNNSLGANRLGTDINAYLDNNPSVKSILASGVGVPKPTVPAPVAPIGVNLPTTGSTIDTSIGSINNLQNPEAKYSTLGSINDYLKGNNQIRDKVLEGITNLNNIKLPETQPSYMDTYRQLSNEANIGTDTTRLNELGRAITGTEGDIRGEVAKAGGVANASQLASLTAERAKPVIAEYNVLKDALAVKNDMISKLMTYGQLDRADAEKQIELKTNLNEKIIDSYNKLGTADRETVQTLMTYDNNQKTLAQNKLTMLLESGGLSTLPDASLAKIATDTGLDIATLKSASSNVDIANKLKNELTKAQTQASYANAAQSYAAAAKDRQGITPAGSANSTAVGIVNDVNNILGDSNLNSATGMTSWLALPGTETSALKGKIDQVKNALTLENRAKLKGSGAVSDSENKMLADSASILSKTLSYDDTVKELKKVKGVVSIMNGIPAEVTLTDASGASKDYQFTNSAQLENAVKAGLIYNFK